MLLPIGNIYNFIIATTSKYRIDETHGIRHLMNCYRYSEKIYNSEVKNTPILVDYERTIYTSTLLHDLCDKKYLDEKEGLSRIGNFLKTNAYREKEIENILNIIETLSYSKIKKTGLPNHGELQLPFQITRESDLLESYDVDRCILFDMLKNERRYVTSFNNAKELFDVRMFKYLENGDIKTSEGIKIAKDLELKSKNRIEEIEKTLSNIRTK